jgi:hypothetical protein
MQMASAVIKRLVTYRLEEDLSYPALAARMSEHGCRMSAHGLYSLLRRRPASKSRDRTLYKIDKFFRLVAAANGNGHAPAPVVRPPARRKTTGRKR